MEKVFSKVAISVAFFLIIAVLSSQSAFSQSVWTQDFENRSKAGIEFMVPSYSFTGDQRGVDFATYFYTNIPVSKTWSVKIVFPISRFNGGGSKLSSGNPFIGFQYFSPNSGFKLDFGARLPTIQQNQFGSHLFSETFSAYGVGAFNAVKTAVRFNIHYQWNSESNWVYKVSQGLEAVAPSHGPLAVVYKFYGQALYKVNDNFSVGAGLEGDLLTDRNHYLFPARKRIQLGLIGQYDFGRLDVGAYMKDNLSFVFDNEPNLVIGLNFGVSL
ncbi:MAG TPA: hypothetical protein VF181_04000 [Balneolaceae bacterium]